MGSRYRCGAQSRVEDAMDYSPPGGIHATFAKPRRFRDDINAFRLESFSESD